MPLPLGPDFRLYLHWSLDSFHCQNKGLRDGEARMAEFTCSALYTWLCRVVRWRAKAGLAHRQAHGRRCPGAHMGLLPPKTILEDVPLLAPFAEATVFVPGFVCVACRPPFLSSISPSRVRDLGAPLGPLWS